MHVDCCKELSGIASSCDATVSYFLQSLASRGKCLRAGVPCCYFRGFTVQWMFTYCRVHSQCERYAGTACSKYLRGSNTFRDSSLGDQIDIERAMVTFILSVNRGSAPGTCRDFIIEMLCHHAFPFCYPNDTSGVESQPVCLRDCLIAKNELCASHWSEIVEGSREYFQLYAKNRTQSFATSVDGTALTECYGFQSQNGGEEPECFTTTWKSQG